MRDMCADMAIIEIEQAFINRLEMYIYQKVDRPNKLLIHIQLRFILFSKLLVILQYLYKQYNPAPRVFVYIHLVILVNKFIMLFVTAVLLEDLDNLAFHIEYNILFAIFILRMLLVINSLFQLHFEFPYSRLVEVPCFEVVQSLVPCARLLFFELLMLLDLVYKQRRKVAVTY